MMPEDFELLISLSRCNDKEEMDRCIDDYNASKKPITNADRIRAMSDEALAQCLSTLPVCEIKTSDCFGRESCLDCVKEWLQQPAEDAADV